MSDDDDDDDDDDVTDHLSDDVLLQVFNHLSFYGRHKARCVCKRWGCLLPFSRKCPLITIRLKPEKRQERATAGISLKYSEEEGEMEDCDDQSCDKSLPVALCESGERLEEVKSEKLLLNVGQTKRLLTSQKYIRRVRFSAAYHSSIMTCLEHLHNDNNKNGATFDEIQVEIDNYEDEGKEEETTFFLWKAVENNQVSNLVTKLVINDYSEYFRHSSHLAKFSNLTELVITGCPVVDKHFLKKLPPRLVSLWLPDSRLGYTIGSFGSCVDNDDDDNDDDDDDDDDDDVFTFFLKTKLSSRLKKFAIRDVSPMELKNLAQRCSQLVSLKVNIDGDFTGPDATTLLHLSKLEELEHLSLTHDEDIYDDEGDSPDYLSDFLRTLSKLDSLNLGGIFNARRTINNLLSSPSASVLRDLNIENWGNQLDLKCVPFGRLRHLSRLETFRFTMSKHPDDCQSCLTLVKGSKSIRNLSIDYTLEKHCSCLLEIAKVLNDKAKEGDPAQTLFCLDVQNASCPANRLDSLIAEKAKNFNIVSSLFCHACLCQE